MNSCDGLSRVTTTPRFAPTMSANCASMKVAAVTKSGASEMAERSSARRSPLSCELEATAALSRFESFKSPLKIRIFRPHTFELLGSACGQLACPRYRRRKPDGFGVFQVGIDGGNDDARFYGREPAADEGDAHP